METVRKPFQGVINTIRFNWHFYVLSIALVLSFKFIAGYLYGSFQLFLYITCILVAVPTVTSLVTSFYIYDLSGLYTFNWLDKRNNEKVIVNINAGFDETSALLTQKFINAELIALDFYDPLKHTEISIKRARKAYAPFPGTKHVTTTDLQLPANRADKIFVIFSAHEIRNENERTAFFKELNRVIKPTGQIYITEHLRDAANFMAYTVGFLHFFPKATWLGTFGDAGLTIKKEIKLTPFISTFILCKNGYAL